MLSGVSTICFAGSYAVALLLEVSRLVFRSRVRGLAMIGFAGAGLVAHTAFLYYRAVSEPSAPLASSEAANALRESSIVLPRCVVMVPPGEWVSVRPGRTARDCGSRAS